MQPAYSRGGGSTDMADSRLQMPAGAALMEDRSEPGQSAVPADDPHAGHLLPHGEYIIWKDPACQRGAGRSPSGPGPSMRKAPDHRGRHEQLAQRLDERRMSAAEARTSEGTTIYRSMLSALPGMLRSPARFP
jgi:hypothetical protein